MLQVHQCRPLCHQTIHFVNICMFAKPISIVNVRMRVKVRIIVNIRIEATWYGIIFRGCQSARYVVRQLK